MCGTLVGAFKVVRFVSVSAFKGIPCASSNYFEAQIREGVGWSMTAIRTGLILFDPLTCAARRYLMELGKVVRGEAGAHWIIAQRPRWRHRVEDVARRAGLQRERERERKPNLKKRKNNNDKTT